MKSTLAQIINSACDYEGVTMQTLISPVRYGEVVKARELVIWNAVKMGHSFSSIGRALNQHHSTIITSAKRTGAI